jgi:NADH-quinone oxidoreductase subunit G
MGASTLHFYDALPEEYSMKNSLQERFTATVKGLQNSQRPIIVCGTDIVGETTPDLAADSALFLRASEKRAGLFYILPGANAYGAALLSRSDDSVERMIEGIEQDSIKVLVVVENDPFLLFPERRRLQEAMDRLELLVVGDYLPSSTVSCADVVLPTKTLFETAGTFINQEGRAQRAFPVHHGGLPIELTGGGGHPPRSFGTDIPGGEPMAAWQILGHLNRALTSMSTETGSEESERDLCNWLAEKDPVFTSLNVLSKNAEGASLVPEKSPENPYVKNRLIQQKRNLNTPKEMEILLVEMTFGTEELSTYSTPIRKMETTPQLWINAKDAESLGFKNKDTIRLLLGGEETSVELCVVENMASGVIILPRYPHLEWQKPGGFSAKALIESIIKV